MKKYNLIIMENDGTEIETLKDIYAYSAEGACKKADEIYRTRGWTYGKMCPVVV